MPNAAKRGAPRDLALVAACAHPVAIGAALVIFANDFGLRQVSPGWWSGKLSDAGWLVVTPILLASGLTLLRVPSKRAREVALATSIAVYLVMQLWPPLGAWFNPMHIADVEDLVVLPAVGLVLVAWRRRETVPSRTSLAMAVPFLGAALVATSEYSLSYPRRSWPCGEDMTWETDVPLRLSVGRPGMGVNSDAFARGIRLFDAQERLVPVIVTPADGYPHYAICAREGLRPESAYRLELGPWTGGDSNELPIVENAFPTVYFLTTATLGVPVATDDACREHAQTLTDEEFDACNQPPGRDTGDTGTTETGEDETGASETGDESGDFDSGGESSERPLDSGEDSAAGEDP